MTAPAAPARPSRILVVEDTAAYAEALERTLALEGHEVLLATRAVEALARARAEPPDLVVLDLGLPDKDGYHVLRELRARGFEAPVLILSARSLEADKVEASARRRRLRDQAVRRDGAAGAHLRAAAAAPARPRRAAPPRRGAGADDAELRDRYGLTDRQVAVARLLAEGCTNAEVAERWGSASTRRATTPSR
jgi:DNA-binding NarL/FixJ family response regulator